MGETVGSTSAYAAEGAVTSVRDFTVVTGTGASLNLSERAGRVLLVVNTASKCGFTPQYAGLQDLWQRFGARGFDVLAFPCNQFGRQEPGADDTIATFCDVHFGLTFPLMAKVEVNGPGTIPLFGWLKAKAPGLMGSQSIKWNFTKFLIDREGDVVRRYGPMAKPARIAPDIEALLQGLLPRAQA